MENFWRAFTCIGLGFVAFFFILYILSVVNGRSETEQLTNLILAHFWIVFSYQGVILSKISEREDDLK